MYKKLLTIFSFLLFVIFFSSVASAQTTTDTTKAAELKMQRQQLQTQKQAVTSQIKREVKQEARIELREQIKERVQTKREEVKEIVAAKREEFKVRLEAIKDEKKKAIVSRIDTKLTNINIKHTDRFTQVLNNLQIILDKIVAEDIDKTKAQAAIGSAKLAVENQAAKTYTITISTETALKSDVGTVTSQLRLDLSSTHKLVVDAKQAVQALRADNALIKEETVSTSN
ncbi:MAG: hypothetical protein Q7R51_01325 [bacterium]|nr:hypothetical protein [bacterium]